MNAFLAKARLIVRNDLRLLRRESRLTDALGMGFVIVGYVLFQVISVAIFSAMKTPPSLQAQAALWWFFSVFMLGTAMTSAVGMLYERSDFDLLLSSPISARAVLLARLGSVASAALLSVAVFVSPLLNSAAIAFSPRYIVGYITWPVMALGLAAVGISFALGLVQILGARRARTVNQVIAALGGAMFLVGFQLPQLLRRDSAARTWLRQFYESILELPGFTLPAQAARGEPGAFLLLLVVTLGVLAGTIWLMTRAFVLSLQEASSIAAKPARAKNRSWTEGLGRATFRKDVRLIVRDPMLIAQVLPQVIYVLPIAFPLFPKLGIVTIGPVGFLFALFLSPLLTAVAVSGEECWDLIRMSPSPEDRLRNAKVAAGIALPVTVVAAASVVLAIVGRPVLGLLTFVFSAICAGALSRLSVRHVQPTPRKDILRPRRGAGGKFRGNTAGALFGSLYFMGTGGGGLTILAWSDRPAYFSYVAWLLLALALLGAGLCFLYIRFEKIFWRDNERLA